MITALNLLGYDATSLAHLYLGSFSHYSLQIPSSSVRLDGECRYTAIFRSLLRCSIGFKSGLSHSMMVPPPCLLHCRDGAWFPPDMMLGIQAKEFNLGFIRPENLVSHGLSPLGAFSKTPSGVSGAFY